MKKIILKKALVLHRYLPATFMLVGIGISTILLSDWFYKPSSATENELLHWHIGVVTNKVIIPLTFSATQPLPKSIESNDDIVELGRQLFHDKRLSADNTVSCATCHNLENGGMDGMKVAIGINSQLGVINTPTVFNSGFNSVLFWDGRAESLEQQVDDPITNQVEMGSSWEQIIEKLTHDPDMMKSFSQYYIEGMNATNIKHAIASFQRTLVTPNSRFDRYISGETTALNDTEIRGYQLFNSYGCISCHQGINLGGNMFEKMGLIGDYFADRGNVTIADNGRFNVTKNPEHMHEFRVASLRNVAKTAPYFHDGNCPTLECAVEIMAKYQLGRQIPDDDRDEIVAFLKALTGTYNGESL